MKVAVLSGKGGAGKTFVSVSLAIAAKQAVYIDCDVEEPNGRLFFKPEGLSCRKVAVKLPKFDLQKCTGCRACVNFCRFNALALIKKRPKVFSGVCHSCGGCELVCPEKAVSEIDREVGVVEMGSHGNVRVVTGILNTGEESGVPVLKAAIQEGVKDARMVVIDCPPGSSCSVMESISASDYCVLVAEPTAFGLHNFKMIYELVTLMHKPCCVVINKENGGYEPLEAFCREHHVPIKLRIPYSTRMAAWGAAGKIAVEEDAALCAEFESLLADIAEEVAR